ncbi:hypothetical protein MKEN_00622500 [Mycena kentingensis (nom. inval.)]|nr:hypothetical protein MKEN_00622500 [Mycena kentingensis (nom. inval.)]
MDTWNEIYRHLSAVPGLCNSIGMEKGMQFVRMAARLKDAIITAQPPSANPEAPPDHLPPKFESFLGSAIGIPSDYVQGCWAAFSGLAWDYKGEKEDRKGFRSGMDAYIAAKMLFPPTHRCTTAGCTNTKLLRAKSEATGVVIYTLADGACVAFAHRLSCDKCSTRYYPNYSVLDKTRTYYDDIPDAIQVAEHHYVERGVLDLFINLMLISWTSATNGARVYDTCLSKPENIPRDHPAWMDASFKIRPEYVWDGFIVLSLLEDHQRRGKPLRVPHNGDQKDRFKQAMSDRNARIQFYGQPELAHYCNKCMRVWDDGKGNLSKVHALVVDGITIGHPCCGVRHCPIPLENNRERFCPGHKGTQDAKCAVEACDEKAERSNGFLTCTEPLHRQLELNHKKRDKAMFQLKSKVVRSGVANPDNAFEAEITAEEYEEMQVDDDGKPCPATKDPNGRKIRALFGRRKTHGEQVGVYTCGTIAMRGTFFGSETVPQTVDLIKKTFREPGSMPEIIFYDNNCTLYQHLAATNDPLLKTVGLPVDVFHWTCKHNKQGTACSYHCNPSRFPELLGEDGKAWFFNSSVAEQTNVWLGGFHAILREMGNIKFNYFLDEMIMRKNRLTIAKLEADGACPGIRPFGYA